MLTLKKHFRRLPNELKLLIFEHIIEARDWPLTSTYFFGPRFWKSLFNKHLPCMFWLWDLDFKLIRYTDPQLTMDWELLFRMLSHRPKIADCRGAQNPC